MVGDYRAEDELRAVMLCSAGKRFARAPIWTAPTASSIRARAPGIKRPLMSRRFGSFQQKADRRPRCRDQLSAQVCGPCISSPIFACSPKARFTANS